MTAILLPNGKQQYFTTAGLPAVGYKVATFAAGTSTPQTTWQDALKVAPQTNPVILDGRGEASIFWDGAYKVQLQDSTGAVIWTQDNLQSQMNSLSTSLVPATNNTVDLGSNTLAWRQIYVGANNAPVLDTVSGNIGYYARTTAESTAAVTPVDFAYAPGDLRRYGSNFGATAANDTTAIKNMFLVCLQGAKTGGASSCSGYIPAGTYLIQEGVLAFDTPNVDAPFPFIYTAGENCVIFKGANFADAPMIAFTNGTATSTAGKYWRGGYLGPIWFQTTRTTGTNSHGLSLRGCQGVTWGHMRADGLFGSTIYMPAAKFTANDPDPYAVQLCYFEGIEANFGTFFALDNENDIGFTVNVVKKVFASQTSQGVIKSGGDQNVFMALNCGNCFGWAYDEGQDGVTIAGAARNVILGGEIDTCQNGIRVNKCFADSFTAIRFIHRYNFGLNTSNLYWPLVSVDIAGGTSPLIQQLHVECMHRIEAGGPNKATLGSFVNFHNVSGGTTSNVEIHHDFIDEGTGFSYVDTDFYSNIGSYPNAVGAVFLSGRRIYDARIASITMVCGTVATSILHTGFNSAANIVQFPTRVNDRNSCFNTSTGIWTAPYAGLVRVTANVALTMAANNSARMAIMELTSGGSYNQTVLYKEDWQITANVQHYQMTGLIQVQQGFGYALSMDQSTAGNITPSLPSGSFIPDLYLHMEMLEAP